MDDTESLFNLSAAPALKKVRNAGQAEVRPDTIQWVPTRFEDKVAYMMTIERNRKAFLAERRRQRELVELGLASAEVRAMIMGRKPKPKETEEERIERRKREAALSKAENELWELFELHQERKRLTSAFEQHHRHQEFAKSAYFAKHYVEKASDQDLEAALRQKVAAFRALASSAHYSEVSPGLCSHHTVESARDLRKNSVTEPKFKRKKAAKLSPNKSPYIEEGRRRRQQRQNCGDHMLRRYDWNSNHKNASNSTPSYEKRGSAAHRITPIVTPLPLPRTSEANLKRNAEHGLNNFSIVSEHTRRNMAGERIARKRTAVAKDRLRQSKTFSKMALRGVQTSLSKIAKKTPKNTIEWKN